MSKPRTYQTEAIIIKKTKLGEADRILTLYTPHLGKIQAVAKGVRRPRSKMSGHLEMLTHSLVSLARGRNLDTVTGSQTINSFLPLKSDLWLASCALYATELVNQFTADHVEDYPLFQLFLETMHQLCQTGDNDMVLRYFEMHLLDEVGYRPQLGQCVSCHLPLEAASSFCPGAGGVLCPGCSQRRPFVRPLSTEGLKMLRLLQNSNCIAVGQGVSHKVSREIRGVIREYVRYLLEREVKSATWLDTLERMNLGKVG